MQNVCRHAVDSFMALNHLSKWLGHEGLSRLILKDFLGLLAERGGRFLIRLGRKNNPLGPIVDEVDAVKKK